MKLAKDARSGDQLCSPTRHRFLPIEAIGVSVPSHSLPPRSTTLAAPTQGLSLTYRPASLASAGSLAGTEPTTAPLRYVEGPQLAPVILAPFRSNMSEKLRNAGCVV